MSAMHRPGHPALRPRSFCVVVLAIGLVLFALPYPAPGQAKRMVQVALARAPLAVVGPSIVDFVSDCDEDRRPLSAMLGDDAGREVLDLSAPGQELSDSINLAAATINNASIDTVVLPITFSSSYDWTTPPYRKFLFYKMVTPRFAVYDASDMREFWHGLSGAERRVVGAYTFEGRRYGDYNSISATMFAREKAGARCPEVATHDRDFTRSYFWWTHLAQEENKALYPLVGNLARLLARDGKRLAVVVLPDDLQLLDALQPGWAAAVRDRQRDLVAGLRAVGAPVLDLSADFDEGEFSTEWCACAHLNERGRRHLSRAVTAALATDRGPPTLLGKVSP